MRELKDLPIGVFDSGLGGLTVVRAIRELLPGEQIIYLGDSARVPYGTRSQSTVVSYARTCAQFLISKRLKMLVVACNTASAVALPTLRQEIGMPVLGVIAAGARAAARTGALRIGVIGTTGTVQSGAYIREIATRMPSCQVYQQPAPLFVPLAEEGWIDGDVPMLAAMRYLEPLAQAKVEVLMLGCTHYPLLIAPIKRALQALECSADVVDSATAMAAEVRRTLDENELQRNPGSEGGLTCFVTDLPVSFEEVSTRFLGQSPGAVNKVDIT
ncbi:MAG: glutamate racemase [Proteobacteria bacterium]|nr:glutamate racemase [Pseudomonadota bacterium]